MSSGQSLQSGAQPGPDTLAGRIELTGSVPTVAVTLILGSGEAVELRGPLLAELRSLGGASVRVIGRRTARSPRPGFEASAYEVLSIDGQRPNVGVLVRRGEFVWLEGTDTLRLSVIPPLLATRIGAKAWVVGPRVDGALQVQSFGVIREP